MGGKRQKWLILCIGLIMLIVIYILFRDRISLINITAIAGFLRELGPWSVLLGGVLILIQTFVPVIPFIVLAGANVLVFGLWGGFLLNWVSAAVASVLMFYVARTLGRDWAEQRMKRYPRIQGLNQFIEQNGFKTILTIRLFPVVPPVMVNLAAGISTMNSRAYILATVIGKLPAIFLESIIGHDVFHFSENKNRLILILAGFGLIFGIGMQIMKKKINIMKPVQNGDAKIKYRTKERVE